MQFGNCAGYTNRVCLINLCNTNILPLNTYFVSFNASFYLHLSQGILQRPMTSWAPYTQGCLNGNIHTYRFMFYDCVKFVCHRNLFVFQCLNYVYDRLRAEHGEMIRYLVQLFSKEENIRMCLSMGCQPFFFFFPEEVWESEGCSQWQWPGSLLYIPCQFLWAMFLN